MPRKVGEVWTGFGRVTGRVALALVSLAGARGAAGDESGPFAQVAQLSGSSDPSGQPNVYFGRSVALSGDTLVVGAPREDTSTGVDAGAAYVYVRSGAAWVLQARLVPSHPAVYRQFGYSVAVSGDTAVIAEPGLETAGEGRAYVFVRSGATWTEQQWLLDPDPFAYPFGHALSVSGDVLVVGAPFAVGGGSAFVYRRTGTTWTHEATLVGPSVDFFDGFGASVAVSGDVILVGASRERGTSGTMTGAVHVFVRDVTGWTDVATLRASDAGAGQEFGTSVSLSADTLVVGAPYADSSAGAAYVFVGAGGTWTEQQKLASQDGAFLSASSVSISGDTALLGAPLSGASLGAAGVVYVFVRSGTTWTEQPAITAPDGASYDDFGAAVWISGDTALVGAPQASARAGVVYVFGRSGASWTEQARIPGPATDTTVEDHFGQAVAASGDTIVVGAPDDDLPTATTAGSVHVFTRSGTDWIRQKLVASNAGINDRFGMSVSVSGDTIVVGAPDVAGPAGTHGYGYAYAFVRDGPNWSEQQVLGSGWSELFGVSVSVSGDTAVVGGTPRPPYYDTGATTVFVRSGTTWTEQQRLLSPLGAQYDEFGSSVSVYGDTLAVADALNPATYVFLRSGGTWTLQQTLGLSGPVSVSEDTLVVGRRVFVRSGATWTLQQELTAADGTTSFNSAQISGTRLVLGRIAAAYVFERSGSTWTERQRLVTSPPSEGFGSSVSLSGAMVVVGDPYRDTLAGRDAGAAFVFDDNTADLWVRKTDGRGAVIPGGSVTYVVTVGNAGPAAAAGAEVTDVLPVALSCSTTCVGTGGAICRAGPFDGSITDSVVIPPGQSVTYTSNCTVSGSASGSLSNTATVTAPATVRDHYPGNNSATDTDTLEPAADLEVILIQSADSAAAGDVFDYVVTVTNRGPWASTGMKVANGLPSGTTLVTSTPGPGVCNLNGGTLDCDLGPLPSGEAHVVTIEVAVDSGARGVLRDVAAVTGNEPDPVAANDTDVKAALVSAPTQFYTLEPCRVVDTRAGSPAPIGGPALAPRSTRVLTLAGHCGIPATARAVALNVTVAGAGADGNLRVFPAGLPVPLASALTYRMGQTRGNNAVVALNAEGQVAIYVAQAARTKGVHLTVDVSGYFE